MSLGHFSNQMAMICIFMDLVYLMILLVWMPHKHLFISIWNANRACFKPNGNDMYIYGSSISDDSLSMDAS